jgi:hypothetical protein
MSDPVGTLIVMLTDTTPRTAIVLRHTMRRDDGFDETAHALHQLVLAAQREHPGWPRHLTLEIEGHRSDPGGFDRDATEIQRAFLNGHLMPFLSEARVPLGVLANAAQDDDPPELLVVDDAERPEWGDA